MQCTNHSKQPQNAKCKRTKTQNKQNVKERVVEGNNTQNGRRSTEQIPRELHGNWNHHRGRNEGSQFL